MKTVVRGWASEVKHVADVPDDSRLAFTVFGSPFTGFYAPIATACARTLRHRIVIMMEVGTKVSCSQCRRLTGIEAQTDESYQPVHQEKVK